MTLSKIISGLLENMTQEALAEELGLDPARGQQTVSNMLRAAPDSTWEKHWTIFLKIYPLIPARELEGPSDKEVLSHVKGNNDSTAPKDVSKKKMRDEKTIAHPFPPRGSPRHSRR